jgi:MFS family permease
MPITWSFTGLRRVMPRLYPKYFGDGPALTVWTGTTNHLGLGTGAAGGRPAGRGDHQSHSAGRMLLAGIMLSGSGSTLAALAPSFPVLLVGRAVAGAGSGMVAITVIVRLIALSEPGARGRTLAFYQGALQAGSSLSPAAAGLASSLLGWPAAFGLAAVTAFAGSVAAWLTGALRSERPGSKADPGAAHGRHAGRPGASTHPGQPASQTDPGRGEGPAGGSERSRGEGPAGPGPGRRLGVGRGSSLAFSLVVVNVATFTIFFTNGGLFQNAIRPFAGIRIGSEPRSSG